jgi:hypothetical protein
MDTAARSAAPAAALERSVSKNSAVYDASDWDLVQAVTDKKVKLEDVKKADLPADLQGLSLAELQEKITQLQTRRSAINLRVQELTKQREAFIAKQQPNDKANTLGDALVKMITQQATEEGFTFE